MIAPIPAPAHHHSRRTLPGAPTGRFTGGARKSLAEGGMPGAAPGAFNPSGSGGSPEGGAVTSGGGTGASTSNAAPHWPQNLAAGTLTKAPHRGQVLPRGWPQRAQNLAPALLAAPQRKHRIRSPSMVLPHSIFPACDARLAVGRKLSAARRASPAPDTSSPVRGFPQLAQNLSPVLLAPPHTG